MPSPDSVAQEVWRTVRELNDSWTKGTGESLADCFHERMVAITPATRERIEGRERCVAAWRGFAAAATIHRWQETDPRVEVFGDTAIVTYYYETRVSMGGQEMTLAGRDMLVLRREQGRWWVIADQFSPFPT